MEPFPPSLQAYFRVGKTENDVPVAPILGLFLWAVKLIILYK